MKKASGGDGIPAETFQTLKDNAVKVLHSICIIKKNKRIQKKKSTSASLSMLKPLCGSQQTGKFLKR